MRVYRLDYIEAPNCGEMSIDATAKCPHGTTCCIDKTGKHKPRPPMIDCAAIGGECIEDFPDMGTHIHAPRCHLANKMVAEGIKCPGFNHTCCIGKKL